MKKIYFFFIMGCLLGGLGARAQSVVYANSSTGNDATGDGTAALPFKTFYQAYSNAVAGDTISLAGTFTWTDADETGDETGYGFTLTKQLIIRGESAATTFVQAATTAGTADRGVFWVKGASVTFQDLTIRYGNNTYNSGGSGSYDYYAGGILAGYWGASGTLTLRRCRIVDNASPVSSYQRAGGLLVAFMNFDISDCDISGNSAKGNYYAAGGVYMRNMGVGKMTNTSICNNTITTIYTSSYALTAGGLKILASSGTMQLSNITIADNTSDNSVGGFHIAPTGGAITVTNCTIAENTSTNKAYGGFLKDTYGSSAVCHFKNTIIANNHSGSTTAVDYYNNSSVADVDEGYNLAGTSSNITWAATSTTGVSSTLLLASTPAVNSASNLTKTLALGAGSIAINAGNSADNSVSAVPLTDQRGISRGKAVDIGAYEYKAIWTGNTGTSNSTASNWEAAALPVAGSDVDMAGASNDMVLLEDLTLGTIDFGNSGHRIITGDYTLTVDSVIGGGASNYVQTSGTGALAINIGNTYKSTFPVGKAGYNPVVITNRSGSGDLFSVNVVDEVYANAVDGATVSSGHVKRTWNISKSSANGGSGIDFEFNWNSSENDGMTTPQLYHYSGGWNAQSNDNASYTSTSLTYTGYTGSFSPFSVMESNAALPVTWLGFTARAVNTAVLLNWSTAVESNTRDFVVQHSINGTDWNNLGIVQAAGNSTFTQSYQYTHATPVAGINYYRLQQRDLDGNSSFSSIVRADLSGTAAHINIYPNPVVNGRLYINLPQAATVRLFSATGILLQAHQLASGIRQLDLSRLAKGVYHLEVGGISTSVVIQ